MSKYIDSEKFITEIERRESEIKSQIAELGNFESNEIGLFNYLDLYDDIRSFITSLQQEQDMGEVSDGYHTFNELYYYRMLYNAAFFNILPKEWVHKSKRHHTGEECFGGGWFIVTANLPTGQVSNHYELKDWDLFKVPEREIADEWDGHTPQEAAKRIYEYLQQEQPFPCWIHANYSDKPVIRYSPSGDPYLQNGSYMIWLSDLETLPKDRTDLTNPEPEQPEVDLEKEIDRVFFKGDCGSQRLTHKEIAQIARHFAEWGAIHLNARKEQPEADLEEFDKDVTKLWGRCAAEPNDSIACLHAETFSEIARHFWNKGYNARKEE